MFPTSCDFFSSCVLHVKTLHPPHSKNLEQHFITFSTIFQTKTVTGLETICSKYTSTTPSDEFARTTKCHQGGIQFARNISTKVFAKLVDRLKVLIW